VQNIAAGVVPLGIARRVSSVQLRTAHGAIFAADRIDLAISDPAGRTSAYGDDLNPLACSQI